MLLKKIKLSNYRQYTDETIEFPLPSDKRNVVVVVGKNGAGKTNLLMNPIAWCLYGEEPYLNEKSKALPLVNMAALEDKPNGCPVEVEITMLDDEKNKLIFHRSTEFRKENGKPCEIPFKHKFVLWREMDGDLKPVSPELITKIIPRSLLEYFLFDGERLENYFKEKKGEEIKKELFKLSRLELLENVINHLKYVESNFVKRSKKLDPKIGEKIGQIQEQIDAYEKSLKNYQEELDKLNEELESERQELDKVRDQLKSMPNVKTLQASREELEKRCKELEKTIDDKRRELEDFLLDAYTYLKAFPAIQHVINEINQRQEEGKIPPSIDPRFIQKLLKEGRCICGSDISEKNESGRKKVKELLEKIDKISQMSAELVELKTHLNYAMEGVEGLDNKIKEMENEIERLENNRKECSVELNKIKKQLEGRLEEKYKELNEKYEKIHDRIEKLDEEKGERKAKIEEAKRQLDELKRQRDEEIKKSQELEYLKKIISFCGEAIELATKVKENILTQTREKINEITKNIFLELIWKKEEYKDIRINENYEISVFHRSGLEGLGSLSRGEMECLALSFINALGSYSGFNFPIIMDTPLGRISEEGREKICKIFSKLADKQIILLLTDAEYAPNVNKALIDSLLGEYRIEFQELSNTGAIARVVKIDRK